jgi:hypothetical protein
VNPRTNFTVLTTRDGVAELLHSTRDALAWPVRLALASAFNYLDDALPLLTPPPLPRTEEAEYTDITARVGTLRADLLGLIDDMPTGVDPYAVGHAAAELGTALRELTAGRPA